MSDEKALVPVEQKTVEFYEDQVTAVRLANGEVFIPLRPIVEGLGLDWPAQTRRINRDPILSAEVAGLRCRYDNAGSAGPATRYVVPAAQIY